MLDMLFKLSTKWLCLCYRNVRSPIFFRVEDCCLSSTLTQTSAL